MNGAAQMWKRQKGQQKEGHRKARADSTRISR